MHELNKTLFAWNNVFWLSIFSKSMPMNLACKLCQTLNLNQLYVGVGLTKHDHLINASIDSVDL